MIPDGGGLMSWLVPSPSPTSRRRRGSGRTSRARTTTTAVVPVLAALAVCSLVVSCSGDGDGGSQAAASQTTSPTPTPTASALPSLSAEDQALKDAALAMEEPVPPEGMNENTPDGLALATGYFLDLYPYVFATGDLTAWEEMSEDNCIFCNSVIDNATGLHEGGGWADPWEEQITLVSYGSDPADPDRYVVTASISSPDRYEYSGSPVESVEIAAGESLLLVQIRWSDGQWHVEECELS